MSDAWQYAGPDGPPKLVFPGSGASFQGLGDVISLDHYWGTRAYTAAGIGANVIKLRESGGNTTQIFTSIAGGGLDLAAIATFKGANNLFVDTLYDQVGTNNFIQATQANQPGFALAAIGTLPAITFSKAVPQFMISSANVSAASQPISLSTVSKRNASGSFDIWFDIGDANNLRFGFGAAANSMYFDVSNTGFSSSCADAAFHAIQLLWSGASSVAMVNGATTSGTDGTAGIIGGVLGILGRQISGIFPADGQLGEIGYGASSINQSNANTNQRAYFGI